MSASSTFYMYFAGGAILKIVFASNGQVIAVHKVGKGPRYA